MSENKARDVRRVASFLLVAALAATCAATIPEDDRPDWRSPGLIGNGGWPFSRAAVVPEEAEGASYLPGSSVLGLPDGKARLIPFGLTNPVTLRRCRPARGRGRTGRPGVARRRATCPATPPQRDAASRALLDLRMLTLPNGASTASWYGSWNYMWPRDGAFTAAAFAVTGHGDDAQRVLYFLARAQDHGGLWAARYRPGRYRRRRRAPGAARQPGLGAVGDVVPARDRPAGGEPVDAVADGAPRRRPRRRLPALRRAPPAVTGLLGAEHLTRAGPARADARRVRPDAGRPAPRRRPSPPAGARPTRRSAGASPPSASKRAPAALRPVRLSALADRRRPAGLLGDVPGAAVRAAVTGRARGGGEDR